MAQGSVDDRGYTQSQQLMLDDAKRTHAATTATAQRALQVRASSIATDGLATSAPPHHDPEAHDTKSFWLPVATFGVPAVCLPCNASHTGAEREATNTTK